MRTIIENGIVIAWSDGRHRVLDRGVVVFEDDTVTFVGKSYGGETDETIDATGHLVIPGLVNAHTHVTDSAYTKGYLEDQGSKDFSTLYKVLPAIRHATDPEAQLAAAECAFVEMLLSGSTTVVELGFDYEIMGGADIANTEKVAEVAARVGLRCYIGPRYRTGYYGLGHDGSVFYRNYPNAGRERFDECVKFCREYNDRHEGRIRTMLAPGQVDTCDRDLLVETRRVADEIGVSIQLHAGQSPTEYRHVRETQGMTTVEYMADTGLLGSDFLIGHGMWLAEDGNVEHLQAHEVTALRESATTITHLPWVKARQSSVINSFHKYRKAGINVALGMDTYPFDMFNEMRFAAVICKVVEQDPRTAIAADVFDAATVAGANALGRPDLGRIAPGCKADIVLVDVEKPHAVPMRDPFKFLVLGAYGSDVDWVIVDGRTIVADSRLVTVDVPDVIRRLNEASARVWGRLELS